MLDLPLDTLHDTFGFGVAGNFAGHLEQAGEAADFRTVTAAAADAPKGIFPWYVPGGTTFLGTFPLSHDRLTLPRSDSPLNLQIEPEVGVLFDVDYSDGHAATIRPIALGAFNDCSIRRPGATKISEKKNWGPASKGIASRLFPAGDLDPEGACRNLRLASFLRRNGGVHEYGVDSAVADYSYIGGQLTDWVVERLRNQTGSPDTPLEPVGEYLAGAGKPRRLLVGIGATRYTPFGEENFLTAGDEAIVIVYDATVTSPEAVRAAVDAGREAELPGASVLAQTVGVA